ncbi:MAG: SRPBCC domain-containing protein [Acidimicrobiia bacterium]
MPVIDVTKDPAACTMTVTSEYDAPVERCWQLWADPRQLERWWGPPVYPATFVEHDLTPGKFCTYYMTGPEGDTPHGWWRVVSVEPPHGFEIEDGFGDEPGNDNGMPLTRMRVRLADRSGGGTRMTVTSTFPSAEAMAQLVEMGMEEGMLLAAGQIDAILAEG